MEQSSHSAEPVVLSLPIPIPDARGLNELLWRPQQARVGVRRPSTVLITTAATRSAALKLSVRRETGKEYGVKVSDDKDIASHVDPKPCGGVREGAGEASAGACAGWPLSLENFLSGADTVVNVEGNMQTFAIARTAAARRGRRTRHAQKFLVREPGDLGIDLRASDGPASRRLTAARR